jgi:hypothetical protein
MSEKQMLKFLYGYDSFERHRATASLVRKALPPPASILDVGGEVSLRCNHLGRFLKGYTITTANVERASDISYDGEILPFDDKSFDIVVSIDTAEHVPKEKRQKWIEGFFRVAKRFVVLCAPLGTEFNKSKEFEMNEFHRKLFGYDHHYLKEHIDCGLPEVEEIRSWANGMKYSLYFEGDARTGQNNLRTLFRLQKSAGPLKTPAKLLHQLYTLKNYEPLNLETAPNKFTRRWYLLAECNSS